MTRDERLAEQEQKRTERLRRARQRLTATRRERRALVEEARAQRRKLIGLLVDEAGLFVWDDGTLTLLFAQLARLRDTPDPVAVLEALLGEVDVSIPMAVSSQE